MQKPIHKQNPRYKDIISKIIYLRKLLLVYRILHHDDIIEEVSLNIDGRAWELTSPQIFLFNSDMLACSKTDKPALQEVLKTLSRFLQKKGEITKKTLEGIVHEALEKALFPVMTAKTVIDVSGKNFATYTISNEDVCDKVRKMVDGVPSINPNEYAFYSADYGKITHKRILKICRDRFSAELDSIGTGNEKIRALTFVKDIVEKIGKTFEIISEIKIIQQSKDGEESNTDDWDIPSQNRPTENSGNHAQGEGVGTLGRKYAHFEPKEGETDRDVLIKYFSERQRDRKELDSINNTLHKENGSNSVPTSQGNGCQFRCYHPACDFHTDNKLDYENMIARHWQQKHTGVPLLYPTKTEIEKYGLMPQGKSWEI